MEFKNRKIDGLTLIADLLHREVSGRDSLLAASLRRIEIVEQGRYGDDKPDVRLSIALAPGLEAPIEEMWVVDDDAPVAELLDTVQQLADAAERIFDDRYATIEMVREVRAALSRECSKGRRRGLPYRTLDISLTPSEGSAGDQPVVEVTVEVVGSLQAFDRRVFVAETADHVVAAFADMREEQDQLLVMRNDLTRAGADVSIDAVTLAALEDAGIAPERAIDDLRKSEIGIVDIKVRPGQLTLYVENGVIKGNVPLGNGMWWKEGRLTVPKTPGISPKSVKGKRLNTLVPHDFFEPGLEIFDASEVGDNLVLTIVTRPVALSFGEHSRAA